MIRRLLIANRGEIACRIVRTAHRMGIDTVGVYTAPDADALHVDAVDVAVAVDGAGYLDAERLVRVAIDRSCDAVHPGYGFLAENAAFAQMVTDAGLTWVGPPAGQVELLGDKLAVKRLAVEAGVPTSVAVEAAPGSIPAGLDLPVIVKAAAGGGGRGMRVVRSADELPAAVEAASREAASAFGDGRVFIEPYVEPARHIEVQILGDRYGNVVHLGERECSIQRRHQKIIEESPSSGLDVEVRSVLLEGAVALARTVGYENAGTVEFLVGDDGAVDLLEVNTRLQVEHPVTEAVTGLDLVELQLRIAAGETLPLSQDEIVFDGHAIEARLVAEDPAAGWLPSAGALTAFAVDGEVRVDSGVRPGSRVSTAYDSLLAKVVAHGTTRAEAAARLVRALRAAEIAGVVTNRDVLVAILTDPEFLAGETTTGFLGDHPALAAARGPEGDDRLALLVAAVVWAARRDRARDPHRHVAPPGWRNVATLGLRSVWEDRFGEPTPVEERWRDDDSLTVAVGSWPEPDADGALGPDERRRVEVEVVAVDERHLSFTMDGTRRRVSVAGEASSGWTVTGPSGGATWLRRARFVEHRADEAGSGPVSPLPGTVLSVAVDPGVVVAEGEVLVVVEAMKMEHTIRAPSRAIVREVLVAVGDRVDAGDLLVALDTGS